MFLAQNVICLMNAPETSRGACVEWPADGVYQTAPMVAISPVPYDCSDPGAPNFCWRGLKAPALRGASFLFGVLSVFASL